MMIEPRRLVIHAAANGQTRTPLVGLKVWPTDPVGIHQRVGKNREVFCRIAKDRAPTERDESIVVATGTDVAVAALSAPIMLAKLDLDARVTVEEVRPAEETAQVDCVVGGRNRRLLGIRLHRIHCSFGRQIAVAQENIPS